MIEYEFTYITKADIPEADKAKVITKYENVFLNAGGQVLKKDDWGVKRLAFPIKRQYRGHYWHYDFVTQPENITEAERLMRIDENVLRYMSIKVGAEVDIEKRKQELVKKVKTQNSDEFGSQDEGDSSY